jgi:hypothetical protein
MSPSAAALPTEGQSPAQDCDTPDRSVVLARAYALLRRIAEAADSGDAIHDESDGETERGPA